jgi:hypothetical protein
VYESPLSCTLASSCLTQGRPLDTPKGILPTPGSPFKPARQEEIVSRVRSRRVNYCGVCILCRTLCLPVGVGGSQCREVLAKDS